MKLSFMKCSERNISQCILAFRDLFYENHVVMSMEFRTWTDIHRVRSELDIDLDLGDAMSNFDGFNSISYQSVFRSRGN